MQPLNSAHGAGSASRSPSVPRTHQAAARADSSIFGLSEMIQMMKMNNAKQPRNQATGNL